MNKVVMGSREFAATFYFAAANSLKARQVDSQEADKAFKD